MTISITKNDKKSTEPVAEKTIETVVDNTLEPVVEKVAESVVEKVVDPVAEKAVDPSEAIRKQLNSVPSNWSIAWSANSDNVIAKNHRTGDSYEGTMADFNALLKTYQEE